MMMIRRAGHEGTSFCRSFFRAEEVEDPTLREELYGLAASFRSLEDYGSLPGRQDPSHG
ncbi:MAG: hypothetical protein AAGB15_07520 [Pseudomonadota bacterium]